MSLDSHQQAALAEALSRHLPDFRRLESVERLTAGASLETYRLGIDTGRGPRRLAMRRTPGGAEKLSAAWTPSVEAEAMLFRVARENGIPEPQVFFVLSPEDGLGSGFIMEWLDGETLGQRIVAGEALAGARATLARECGEILGRIHSIDIAASGLDVHLHVWPTELLVRSTIDKYAAYGVDRPMLDYAGRWLLANLPPDERRALVHNDFRNGNLIVAPEGVVAVLDWEHSYVGDPLRDLGWLCANSWRYGRPDLPVGGFGSYDQLLDGYEAVTGIRVSRDQVRFWEIFGALYWAVGCMELANQHRSGQAKSVERLAIGRRVSECEIDCANLLLPPLDRPLGDIAAPATRFADAHELIDSVVGYLREEVARGDNARLAYLARVSANSLSIVARELTGGPAAQAAEQAELAALLGQSGDADSLRAELSQRLRAGTMPLDQPGLAAHLRRSVEAQIAIDQPRYSGRTHS